MSKRKKNRSRRSLVGKLLMLVALAGLAGVVVSHFTDFSKMEKTLGQGNWSWIALGIAVHLVYFYFYALLYRIAFSIVGVSSSGVRLLPILFAGIFLNAVVPTGGAGAAALFVDDAVKRGQSGARATVGVVLVLVLDLVTLLPFIIYGLAFLARHGAMKSYDWIGASLFVGYAAVLLAMLVLARVRFRALEWLLCRVRSLVHRVGRRFHKPDLLDEEWPERIAREFNMAAHEMGAKPGRLGLAALWAFAVHVVNLVGLWALLRAFDISLPVGGLVAAFGMGIIFFVIAVIPEGVAVVEAVMTLIFTTLGIGKTDAITATMVFRTVNFWLPLAVGIFTLWRIRNFGGRTADK